MKIGTQVAVFGTDGCGRALPMVEGKLLAYKITSDWLIVSVRDKLTNQVRLVRCDATSHIKPVHP